MNPLIIFTRCKHFNVDGKRPLTFFVCVVMCHCKCEILTTKVCCFFPHFCSRSRWMKEAKTERVLQGTWLCGMHAGRLGLSVVKRAGCTPVAPLLSPVCFDTSDAVSFNNTSFILAINLINPSFVTSPSSNPHFFVCFSLTT